jgi:chromosome segregation ATPase
MRMPMSLSALLARNPSAAATKQDFTVDTETITEIERSAASFIRVLGSKNEALRNRCEHVIGLTRVIQPLTNELSSVFEDFQKVVQELHTTAGQLEELKANYEAQRQFSDAQGIEIQSLYSKLEDVQQDNERLLTDNLASAQNYSVLEEQFRITRDQLGEKSAHLRSREFEIENLKNENEVLTEEVNRQGEKLREASRNVAELQDERRALNDRFAQKSEELAQITKAMEELSQQATALKKQVLEASAAADKARSRLRVVETEQVNVLAENESLRSAVAGAEARTEQTRTSFEIKIEALNSRIRVSDQLLSQSREEIRRLSEEQLGSLARIRELEALQGKVSEANEEVARVTRRSEDAERMVSSLSEKNAALFSKLQSAEELNKQAAARIESLQKSMHRFEKESETRYNALQARVNQLTEALSKEQIERSFVEGALEVARRDRAQLQQTIVDLKGTNNGNGNAGSNGNAPANREPENIVVMDNMKSTVQREIDEIMTDLRRSHTDVPKLRRTRKAKDDEAS